MNHTIEDALRSDDGNPALLDTATGALSRQAFTLRLEEAAALAGRLRCGLSVLMLDLRGAEALCFAHGPEVVDRVLAEMVDRIWGQARRSDTVARMGPARLTILLSATNQDGAELYASRLLPRLTAPYHHRDAEVTVTVEAAVVGTVAGEIPDSAAILTAIAGSRQ